MRAAQFVNKECVLLLLNAGANPLAPQSICGMTALDLARLSKNQEIIAIMEQRAAQILNGAALQTQPSPPPANANGSSKVEESKK